MGEIIHKKLKLTPISVFRSIIASIVEEKIDPEVKKEIRENIKKGFREASDDVIKIKKQL